jgi:cytochrome c oxidase subunit 4
MMGAQIRILWLVWVALMALLALTVALTFAPLGPWRLAISLAIAAAKAALVGSVFMELRGASSNVRLVAAATTVMLLVLIFLSGVDAAVRTVGA